MLSRISGPGLWSAILAVAFVVSGAVAEAEGGEATYDACVDGEPETAMAACTRLIDGGDMEGVALAFIYSKRCYALGAIDRNQEAADDCEEALRINPDLDPLHVFLCSVDNDLGQPRRALDHCSRSIVLYPDVVGAWEDRGRAYLLLDQPEEGLEDLNHAVAQDPVYASTWFYRGVAYLELGQFDDALADFDRSLAIQSDISSTYYYRGHAYCWSGTPDPAMADLTRYYRGRQDLVGAMQESLVGDYYYGAVDGILGEVTLEAMRAWIDDGCPGPNRNAE